MPIFVHNEQKFSFATVLAHWYVVAAVAEIDPTPENNRPKTPKTISQRRNMAVSPLEDELMQQLTAKRNPALNERAALATAARLFPAEWR